ncbi:hypothetical protein BRUCa_3193 [Brucella melitensis]|nr:hypothetical protein BM28_B1031 [Brucella melitensis M28]
MGDSDDRFCRGDVDLMKQFKCNSMLGRPALNRRKPLFHVCINALVI